MEITEIIGKGKPFEPPFHTDDDGMYIFDKNNQMMLETRGFGHLQYLYTEAQLYCEVYPTLAQHICDLLNRELAMDREEAKRNISLVTGYSEKQIEDGINEINRRQEPQTYTLVNYSGIFSPKPEIAQPLTPKQYGQALLNRKKKRK